VVTGRCFLFVFRSPWAARAFVKRVVDLEKMVHLAFFVRDEAVIVLDGDDGPPRGRRLVALARSSGSLPSSAKS